MTLIHVPKPPKNAWNPDRPVSTLLKSQVEHVHEAEKRLPTRYRSELYPNAIKTEGEAAKYIQDVTEAIHRAHQDADSARRVKNVPKRESKIAIAAVSDEPAKQKPASEGKAKKNAGSAGKKKS